MRGGQEQQKKGKNPPPPNFMGRAQPCQPAPGSTVHCTATERPRFSTSQYQTSCSSSGKSGAHQGPSKEPGYPRPPPSPTLAHPEPPGSRWPPSGCRGLAAQHRAAAPQQAPLRASAPGTAPPCAAPTGRRRPGAPHRPPPRSLRIGGGTWEPRGGGNHEWVH